MALKVTALKLSGGLVRSLLGSQKSADTMFILALSVFQSRLHEHLHTTAHPPYLSHLLQVGFDNEPLGLQIFRVTHLLL